MWLCQLAVGAAPCPCASAARTRHEAGPREANGFSGRSERAAVTVRAGLDRACRRARSGIRRLIGFVQMSRQSRAPHCLGVDRTRTTSRRGGTLLLDSCFYACLTLCTALIACVASDPTAPGVGRGSRAVQLPSQTPHVQNDMHTCTCAHTRFSSSSPSACAVCSFPCSLSCAFVLRGLVRRRVRCVARTTKYYGG